MAGSRTGTPTIVRLARRICKLVQVFGASDLAARTTPEFAAAVEGLVAACMAFQALDDYPMEIDTPPPLGPEDQTLGA